MASPSAEAAAAPPAPAPATTPARKRWLWSPHTQEPRRDQLDGLRAFLFVCVFAVHHELEEVEYLTYSLSTFFVMSGFLITRVLWMCKAETLWGKLKIFYVRRVIRIVPAYAFVVALLLIFDNLQNPAAYVFYYLNIKVFLVSLHQELPEFITWWSDWDRQDLHLWSMSVEEQFYLIFPWVYFLVPARNYGKAFVAAVVLGLTTRTFFMHYYPMSFYGFLLTSCVEYFAWGALFSYLDLSGTLPARPSPWWSLYLPVAATLLLIGIEYGYDFDGYFHQRTSQFLGDHRAAARPVDVGPVERRSASAHHPLPQLEAVCLLRPDQLSDVPDAPDLHRAVPQGPRAVDPADGGRLGAGAVRGVVRAGVRAHQPGRRLHLARHRSAGVAVEAALPARSDPRGAPARAGGLRRRASTRLRPRTHMAGRRRLRLARLTGLVTVLLAVGVAVAPRPAEVVERVYAARVYPALQALVTGLSNAMPFALFDVVLVMAVAGGIWLWTRALLGARRARAAGPLVGAAGMTAVAVAAGYLWFVAMWGLNYARPPLDVRLGLPEAPAKPRKWRRC